MSIEYTYLYNLIYIWLDLKICYIVIYLLIYQPNRILCIFFWVYCDGAWDCETPQDPQEGMGEDEDAVKQSGWFAAKFRAIRNNKYRSSVDWGPLDRLDWFRYSWLHWRGELWFTWWLIPLSTRGLVHPSYGIRVLIHVIHWGELSCLRFTGGNRYWLVNMRGYTDPWKQ